jgi:hypothetical protein
MIASPRRKFIVWLDTILLIILVLLLSPRLTGLAVHGILGVIFFIPIIIHLLIAWPWIQKATKNFFIRASKRTRFNFFLNAILFILIITELVSGVIISELVLPYFGIDTINDRLWRATHNLPLNLVVVFGGLHIAMNWGWILAAFKKKAGNFTASRKKTSVGLISTLKRIGIIILATALVAIVLYGIVGQPSIMRAHSQNEISRFNPTIGHGTIQLFGEAFFIAFVAFIGIKWLRIRL